MLDEGGRKYKIGIDFGGSHFGVGITDDAGELLVIKNINVDLSKYINQEDKEEEIIETIIPMIDGCIRDAEIERLNVDFIGIGVPGSYVGTKIVKVPNMGLKDYDIGEDLKSKIGSIGLQEDKVRILVENDGACAAVGETVSGSLKGIANGIHIVFGTGVGAGVILNGKLYKGEHNSAAEIGHMRVDRSSNIRCGCGEVGCMETLCSVKRLRENISDILSLNTTIDGIELTGILNRIYDTEDYRIIEKIQQMGSNVLELLNERTSEEIEELYEEYKDSLVWSLINVVNVYDPKRISIGGSLSYFVDPYLEEILKRVNQGCFHKERPEGDNGYNYEIVKAVLENDAGIIGAAMLEKF